MTDSILETKVVTNSAASQRADLLALVNKVTGRSFRTLPEKGVKKTLDAFSLVEIETALTALAADPWHKPKLKELSVDYFIRSTTIDRFMEQKKLTPAEHNALADKAARGEATEDELQLLRRNSQSADN